MVALFGCGLANAADDDFDTLTKRTVQGDAGAQNLLGAMYSEGSGVPQDDAMAYAWFNVAAASGFEMAKEARDMVRKMATPSQIGKGQSLATVIFARIQKWKQAAEHSY